mmetsp:Transcript_73374/g.203700  ORF Transcript_73374/g.203700 Transcript_73374/m.203700 type:complete len:341 (-) Transcript_73374:2570-3592(-)
MANRIAPCGLLWNFSAARSHAVNASSASFTALTVDASLSSVARSSPSGNARSSTCEICCSTTARAFLCSSIVLVLFVFASVAAVLMPEIAFSPASKRLANFDSWERYDGDSQNLGSFCFSSTTARAAAQALSAAPAGPLILPAIFFSSAEEMVSKLSSSSLAPAFTASATFASASQTAWMASGNAIWVFRAKVWILSCPTFKTAASACARCELTSSVARRRTSSSGIPLACSKSSIKAVRAACTSGSPSFTMAVAISNAGSAFSFGNTSWPSHGASASATFFIQASVVSHSRRASVNSALVPRPPRCSLVCVLNSSRRCRTVWLRFLTLTTTSLSGLPFS